MRKATVKDSHAIRQIIGLPKPSHKVHGSPISFVLKKPRRSGVNNLKILKPREVVLIINSLIGGFLSGSSIFVMGIFSFYKAVFTQLSLVRDSHRTFITLDNKRCDTYGR